MATRASDEDVLRQELQSNDLYELVPEERLDAPIVRSHVLRKERRKRTRVSPAALAARAQQPAEKQPRKASQSRPK
jgi:hypothetical protein